jgi:hypothetical protein
MIPDGMLVADSDIPILKEAKTYYAKLQLPLRVDGWF